MSSAKSRSVNCFSFCQQTPKPGWSTARLMPNQWLWWKRIGMRFNLALDKIQTCLIPETISKNSRVHFDTATVIAQRFEDSYIPLWYAPVLQYLPHCCSMATIICLIEYNEVHTITSFMYSRLCSKMFRSSKICFLQERIFLKPAWLLAKFDLQHLVIYWATVLSADLSRCWQQHNSPSIITIAETASLRRRHMIPFVQSPGTSCFLHMLSDRTTNCSILVPVWTVLLKCDHM